MKVTSWFIAMPCLTRSSCKRRLGFSSCPATKRRAAPSSGTDFRKAAAALNVQESAISRRIRDLEDAIGVALFIRHHGGVHLTHAGQRFLARARKSARDPSRGFTASVRNS
jgi:hypothetical protein